LSEEPRRPATGTGRWLLVLILTAILTQTTLNLVRPVTTYKLLTFSAGPVAVGLTTAAYALLPLLSAMWLGRASSRIRRIRYLMLAGVLLFVLGAAAIASAPGVLVVAAGSAVLGMGHLMFTIGGQSSIARFFPDDQLDKGFGWFTAAYSVGQFLGPLLGGLILGNDAQLQSTQRSGDIALSLWLGAVIAAVAIPLLLPNLQPRRAGRTEAVDGPARAQGAPARSQATILSIIRIPGMASLMFASLTLLAIIDILAAFLPLVAEHHAVAPTTVGVLLAVRGAASVLSRLILPWASKRFDRQKMVLGSLFGSGLAIALVPLLMEHLGVASLALFAGGFLLGLGQPLTMTMVSTSVPGQDRGAALAVRLMGNRLGQVVVPMVAGTAAVGLGPAGAIWFCCALLAASGLEKSLRRRAT